LGELLGELGQLHLGGGGHVHAVGHARNAGGGGLHGHRLLDHAQAVDEPGLDGGGNAVMGELGDLLGGVVGPGGHRHGLVGGALHHGIALGGGADLGRVGEAARIVHVHGGGMGLGGGGRHGGGDAQRGLAVLDRVHGDLERAGHGLPGHGGVHAV